MRRMIAFVGCRQTGKTSRLVRLSHETGFPILVSTAERARFIESMAVRARLAIPKPMTPHDMARHRPELAADNRVLVDDVADLVGSIVGARVVGGTIEGVAITCDGRPS